MNRLVALLTMSVIILSGCQSDSENGSDAEFSKTVTFVTSELAPDGFDAWTFFRKGPAVDPDTRFDYVVLQPDGEIYYHWNEDGQYGPPHPEGRARCDFAPGFAGGDPSVFYGKNIEIKLRVTTGDMVFDPDAKCTFTFYKGGHRGNVIKTMDAVMK